MRNWYQASTGNHQGLVAEEETGRSVAVTYDKADAALIAAAPRMRAVLVQLVDRLHGESGEDLSEAWQILSDTQPAESVA